MQSTSMHGMKIKRERQFVAIDEEKLIQEVRKRPIIFDRSLKGYRKPAVRENVWFDISIELNSTVNECKKRWRSLRDAFMKQCKYLASEKPLRRKRWLFYNHMEFLLPFLGTNTILEDISYDEYEELYSKVSDSDNNEHDDVRDDNHIINNNINDDDDDDDNNNNDNNDNNNNSNIIVIENDNNHDIKHIEKNIFTENVEEIDVYEQKPNINMLHEITDNNQLISEEYYLDGSGVIIEEAGQPHEEMVSPLRHPIEIIVPSSTGNTINRPTTKSTTFTITPLQMIPPSKSTLTQMQSTAKKNAKQNCEIVSYTNDPDEKFLLSCTPILKRLSNQKNTLARLKIQEILYQIEFGQE